MVEQYNAIAGPFLAISKQLQKSLLRQLQDRRRGGKQTGLLMGRRLDAHALYRRDGKVFCRNKLPQQRPEMGRCPCLLDESGSMSGSRAAYALGIRHHPVRLLPGRWTSPFWCTAILPRVKAWRSTLTASLTPLTRMTGTGWWTSPPEGATGTEPPCVLWRSGCASAPRS